MILSFVLGALFSWAVDFGAIRLINRFEGIRPETPAEERRSFTLGDKYFLPLAAGFEAIVVRQHFAALSVHPWLLSLAAIGIAFGLWTQWQQLRRDPIFAQKFAQWYHALFASPVMVFVILFPIIATTLHLGPGWALGGMWLAVMPWAYLTYDDIRSGRMYRLNTGKH